MEWLNALLAKLQDARGALGMTAQCAAWRERAGRWAYERCSAMALTGVGRATSPCPSPGSLRSRRAFIGEDRAASRPALAWSTYSVTAPPGVGEAVFGLTDLDRPERRPNTSRTRTIRRQSFPR